MEERRTFFVTTVTAQRRRVFQVDAMAHLFLRTLFHYRDEGKFRLHAFVLMPDHFHGLLTPSEIVSLEKALQFIKGGLSFRAKRELNYSFAIWEPSFTNHRIRDAEDYARHVEYIRRNPVRAGLKDFYPYCSTNAGYAVDPSPPGLKPLSLAAVVSPG